MPKLYDVREQAMSFIKSTLGVQGKVVKVKKVSDGWEVEAETAELDPYYQSIRPDYRIIQRNIYKIKFNNNLEAVSYGRKGEKGEEE